MALSFTMSVFAATLFLIIRKPFRWHEAAYAVPAAVLLLLSGMLAWSDAGYVWHLVRNATLSLIGIMALTSVMDEVGFFRWAALHIVRRFGSRPVALLAGLAALAGAISTFFNNDGAVLIMTPIVLEATKLLGMGARARLAFLLGVGLIADTASATLLVSNLTNILTSDYFGISFGQYAKHMAAPGLAAALATIAALLLAFRRTIRRDGGLAARSGVSAAAFPEASSAIADPLLFRLCWYSIVFILAGYSLSGTLHLPVSVIACGGAGLLWLAAASRSGVDSRKIVRRTPWLIVVFALSMNLIVYGLYVHGATAWFADWLRPIARGGAAASVFGAGVSFSLLTAAFNNLPAVLISSLSITQVHGGAPLPYASLIGLSVGAKLTPIGSLATLLWLGMLRRDGIELSWARYTLYGVLLTTPILLLSLTVLWLQSL